MNYPDYDTLREEFEAGNITAVTFVTQQSDEMTAEYKRFCKDEELNPNHEESALHFMEFRDELFEESISL